MVCSINIVFKEIDRNRDELGVNLQRSSAFFEVLSLAMLSYDLSIYVLSLEVLSVA